MQAPPETLAVPLRHPARTRFAVLAAGTVAAALTACTGSDAARRSEPAAEEPAPGIGLEVRTLVFADTEYYQAPGMDTPAPVTEELLRLRYAEGNPDIRLVPVSMLLARALAPYAGEPTPWPSQHHATWEANGLAVLAVPRDRLEELTGAMPARSIDSRQWLGVFPGWTVVAGGPAIPSARLVSIGSRNTLLTGGAVRLLGRCWVIPVFSGPAARGRCGPAIRLELELQHHRPDERAPLQRAMDQAASRPEPVTELPFDELSVGLLASDEYALVIAPKPPGRAWSELVDPPEADLERGPLPETAATLGQTLLVGPGLGRDPSQRSRAVLILIPYLPERYELLAR